MSYEHADRAILQLAEVGRQFASYEGWPFVQQHSHRSESVYLHVHREGAWFGCRIARHAPVYSCSADYEQLLLPNQRGLDLTPYRARIRSLLAGTKTIVADPHEVRAFIEREEQRRADGTVIDDEAGNRWRWCGSQRRWIAESSTLCDPPRVTPCRELDTRTAADLMHRFNTMAKWAHDEFGNRDRFPS